MPLFSATKLLSPTSSSRGDLRKEDDSPLPPLNFRLGPETRTEKEIDSYKFNPLNPQNPLKIGMI